MRLIIALIFTVCVFSAKSQPNVLPAPAQKGTIQLAHGTIHVGNGDVIEDGSIIFSNRKITSVGKFNASPADIKVIDCSGKQLYPGLILSDCNLGLNEIIQVRSTRDNLEVGELNPSVRSVVAYNTDSKIINTLRVNGIELANVVPEGGIISGSSSVMQLDAWNWEDAVYKMDGGIHFRMPTLVPQNEKERSDTLLRRANEQVDEVRTFLKEAKAYYKEGKHEHTNIKFEAVKGLFDGSKTFFVHCDVVNEIMMAIEFAKEFGFKTVIVGGVDSWRITDYLKQNNVAVILHQPHSLPVTTDDAVDEMDKLPYQLQQAGVLYSINDNDENTRGRNLMFNAGEAVAFGLTKEQALQAITLNPAKIFGIDNITGSIETGKDANIIVSDGDILDIKTNNVIYEFIQGRQVNLDYRQKQLYERYKTKYGL